MAAFVAKQMVGNKLSAVKGEFNSLNKIQNIFKVRVCIGTCVRSLRVQLLF